MRPYAPLSKAAWCVDHGAEYETHPMEIFIARPAKPGMGAMRSKY